MLFRRRARSDRRSIGEHLHFRVGAGSESRRANRRTFRRKERLEARFQCGGRNLTGGSRQHFRQGSFNTGKQSACLFIGGIHVEDPPKYDLRGLLVLEWIVLAMNVLEKSTGVIQIMADVGSNQRL